MSIKRAVIGAMRRVGFLGKIPRKRIDIFLKRHAADAKTLDIGGGSGPYAKYFPNRVGIDIESGEGVDFVADAHNLSRFRDGEFERVLCTEVLEHLSNPQKAVDEMYRVLRPGGKVILTTRFIFPLHNIPGDYFRFTRYGLKHLFRNFREVEIKEETNTIETLGVLYERIGFQTTTLFFKPLSLLWLLESKIALFFRFILTKEYGEISRRQETRNIMSSGYYVVAVK